jgi:hypothetical protein
MIGVGAWNFCFFKKSAAKVRIRGSGSVPKCQDPEQLKGTLKVECICMTVQSLINYLLQHLKFLYKQIAEGKNVMHLNIF